MIIIKHTRLASESWWKKHALAHFMMAKFFGFAGLFFCMGLKVNSKLNKQIWWFSVKRIWWFSENPHRYPMLSQYMWIWCSSKFVHCKDKELSKPKKVIHETSRPNMQWTRNIYRNCMNGFWFACVHHFQCIVNITCTSLRLCCQQNCYLLRNCPNTCADVAPIQRNKKIIIRFDTFPAFSLW